jgi:carbon starvation protein
VPAIGYWAQHNAFKDALAAGEPSFGNAPDTAAMEKVVTNTFIQGTLSIVFVTLAIIVIITAILATIKAYRNGGGDETEDAPVPSRIYAPAGLIPSPPEKELEAKWNALGPAKRPARSGH